MKSTKSIILMLSILLASSVAKTNVGDNKAIAKKNTVQIESNAAHGALIIKSTTNCTVQIIDETGHAVLSEKVNKGINEVDLKNIKSAKYKIVVSNGIFSIVRKLNVR